MATTKKQTKAGGALTSVQNFIRRALGQGDDVGTVGVIISALSLLFGAFLICWLLIASFGVGHTQLAEASKGRGSSVLGILLLIVTVIWAWANFSERVPFKVSDMAFIISLLILIILIVNVNTGFFSKVY